MEASIAETPEEGRTRDEAERSRTLPSMALIGRSFQFSSSFNDRHLHKHCRWLWLSVALVVLGFYYFGVKSYQVLSGVNTDNFPIKQRGEEHVPRRKASRVLEQVYHSADVFRRDFKEMEEKFKVYVYPDGDPETYYQTPRKLTGKYSSEGYFFQNLRESRFVTNDSAAADLFFLPISCHKMRGKGISYEKMADIVMAYVESLIIKYPYWNRTLGADHFFVTCHDVGVRATAKVANLVKNSIRVVCSPSYNGSFIPHKDVALPQVLQPFPLPAGGDDISQRTVLGFWAGHRNSKVRVNLADAWQHDPVLFITNNRISRAIGEYVYQKQFYRSKFCVCPAGSQVNSARIAESIHYGCVPVVMADFYDLPFNDVLNWRKFSLVLRERDYGILKKVLQGVTRKEYRILHAGVRQVRRHFEWHSPPVKYDAFHMVMYELWLRRFTIRY
ncbi:hypothetical protein M758_5G177800 [Ceratodon purpureus]|nr:hypothetical protein M758_5G177800 [Ceratodon purpureus]